MAWEEHRQLVSSRAVLQGEIWERKQMVREEHQQRVHERFVIRHLRREGILMAREERRQTRDAQAIVVASERSLARCLARERHAMSRADRTSHMLACIEAKE